MSTMSQITPVRETLRTALAAAHGVALLRGVLDDAASRAVLTLLAALAGPEPDSMTVAGAYGHAFRELAAVADEEPVHGLADAWQAHLTARLLDDPNPWSMQAESAGAAAVAPGLRRQAGRDLRALRLLFGLDAETIWRMACEAVAAPAPALADAWVPWTDLASPQAADSGNAARAALRRRLATMADWALLAGDLAEHWARHGTGIMAHY